MSTFEGMDPDDIPGYLIDDILSWLDKNEIEDATSYYEKHQMDSFRDDKDEKMDEIVEAVLEYKKNG